MEHVDTIVIGAGPAGSACVKRLHEAGQSVLWLDKATFPRLKLCAGWITEKAMNDLGMSAQNYPHGLLEMDMRSHIKGLPFAVRALPTPGRNFSIRRIEFDHWLVERAGVELRNHAVKSVVRREDGKFEIDGRFTSDFLVGAGGTMCPVRKAMFSGQRKKFRQIVTLEHEFAYDARADQCHLYFLHYIKKGYAWYVPKADGVVNVGIGGKANFLKKNDTSIHTLFEGFRTGLVEAGLLDQTAADAIVPRGHPYYLHSPFDPYKKGRCYLIGDAAGLATIDLGEGIGPAIESAQMTADEIVGRGTYERENLTRLSLSGLIGKVADRFLSPKT